MRRNDLTEGYHIFTAISTEDRGYEAVATDLQEQVNKAEKDFDITFISSASFKDDPASRSVYFAQQTCVLKRKK